MIDMIDRSIDAMMMMTSIQCLRASICIISAVFLELQVLWYLFNELLLL